MSIEIRNVSKKFGDFHALRDVSLDINSGELIALLGPSGCGKTTLLRIIAGLETADAGSILFAGEDTTDVHVRERQVGFVFQHYALFRHMTVFENVAFGLRVKPRGVRPSEAQIKQKVHDLLNLVQLDWLGDRFPSQLSGGQRQRIALARALAVEPRVLLLDEPFGALDAKVRQDLRRWLRHLHDELHITSIFVTHDQQEALEVADNIVLMQHGKVLQMGTPQNLYQKPNNAFVYEFLGGSNTFEGIVEGNFIRFDDYLIPHYHKKLEQGKLVKALARPYELDIKLINDNINNTLGILARIHRIHYIGGLIQIELIEPKTKKIFFCETHVHSSNINNIQKELVVDMMVNILPSNLHIF